MLPVNPGLFVRRADAFSSWRPEVSVDKAPENLRKPPAYLEYAADVLSSLQWRMMSFAERGLWDTMRKECWVNGKVPADPVQLSLLLNKPLEEVSQALGAKVLSSFESEGEYLVSPELEAYRRSLKDKRDRMAAGGRIGGLKTQKRVHEARASLQSTSEATLKPLSGDKLKRGDVSRKQMSSGGEFLAEHQKWIDAYEGEPGEPQYKPYGFNGSNRL
jgi:hypothetical protein